MALVTDRELKASVKCNKIDNLYYFYGKDIAAVEAYKKMVVSKTVKGGDEIYNLHAFEGKNFNIDEFTDACEALPMFADYVCCTVCDLNAESLNADALKWLIKFIEDIPDTTVLIFYYTSVDVTDGKKYPTPKNKKLLDAVSKKGTVCNFVFKTPDALGKDIAAKINKNGGIISKEAAVYLAQLCGCNTMIIENEIEKLLAYSAGNEITKDTINMLCPRQIETTTFDLAKAIARKDKYTSMCMLNDLNIEKIDAVPILYAVSGNMVDLYRVKVAMGCAKGTYDVIDDFGYPKNLSFRVDNAFRDVRSYSVAHLRKCIQILVETDVAMKSSNTDKMVLLEEAIVKMLSLK